MVMKKITLKLSLAAALFLAIGSRVYCQSNPDDYKKGTIPEQLDILQSHTRIYEDFRAIREDIFQLVSKNITDTIALAKKRIKNLVGQVTKLNNRIDSINKSMEASKNSLDEMTRTKNSIHVLGLEVNKVTYNSVTWTIIVVLLVILTIGYTIFKANINTAIKAKSELLDLKKEYEDYKQKKRIEYEKMTMSHFNEIKKLKAEYSKR